MLQKHCLSIGVTISNRYQKALPEQAFLLDCFEYQDGRLFWKHRPKEHFDEEWKWKRAGTRDAGREVRTITSHGYVAVSIDKYRYQVHRIIWKMLTGQEPIEDIDHIDGDRQNNKIENLRDVSHRENIWNREISGVSTRSDGTFVTRIGCSFNDKELAEEFYKRLRPFVEETYYSLVGGKKIELPK